ncbi:hypothetical protein CANCADRAFT_58038 [Tortispora caseinolytica NRRL Y-17796]|uniref:Large ribosomal subunit protein uL11m n=1 Tax=Tortispora caseinolytica NRRL Y-17796 TaxID=767744 RepID=A0A1E4TB60_9ASCO|nr:hypothetical protein CANCADRAFT_58038 [Tortispora caseinolytica NRRL Y-17796]
MSQPKNILVKLIVGAGKAAPAPPVGPALGSKGVKAMDFCKEFNARTAHYTPGIPIPCVVTVKPDRSFTFDIKSPPTPWMIMQAAGISQGLGQYSKNKSRFRDDSNQFSKETIGTISLKHVYEIALIKQKDPNMANVPLEGICKSIIGTAKSVGVKVVP